jgi:very-short-patch-repair endonuclease
MERMTIEEYQNLTGKGQNARKSNRKSKRDNDLAMVTLLNELSRIGYKFGGKLGRDMRAEESTVYLEFPFSKTRRFRADLVINSERLIVEIHGGAYVMRRSGDGKVQNLGGAHHSTQGRRRDMEKARLANIEGWIYLEFDWDDVKDGTVLNDIQDAIRQRREREKALGKATHMSRRRRWCPGRDS